MTFDSTGSPSPENDTGFSEYKTLLNRAEPPESGDPASLVQAGLERWATLAKGDDVAARATFAPVISGHILALLGDSQRNERVALVEPILYQGIADARSIGDPALILAGTSLLLQVCDVPLVMGEALIEESLPGLAAAPVGWARTMLMAAADFLFNAAYRKEGASRRESLFRRSLALLQPLLEGSFEPFIEWQHLTLAARLHNELFEPGEAVPLLSRAATLVAAGSAEWVKATIELGLTFNDLERDKEAAQSLGEVLPFAFARAASLEPPAAYGYPHRGFDLSDVASALAESLSRLRKADEAFKILGLSFLDDDGTANPCDLHAMCEQLADDELGVLFCVNNATTMFLFDRKEKLRVRVIPGASSVAWLHTFKATGWFRSVFLSGRTNDIPAAFGQLNEALRASLSGLHGELVGTYRSLAVIPHRSLCLLPFWLLDACADVAVRILPSPRMLVRSGHATTPARLLSIADPNGDLSSARVESEALRQRIGSVMEFEALTGDECALARVLSSLPQAGWWHFAGHAHSDLADPERSLLQLTAGRDGTSETLDAAGILQLDLHGLGLIVLSACSSGVSELRIDSVTRLAGLATVLLKQGATTVVSTLWEIGDDSAALVVDQLFAELLAHAGPADVPTALKHAVQHVRTMSAKDVAARFEQIAAGSADASVAEAARKAARRYGASPDQVPFAAIDQWGAFFTSGARFVSARPGEARHPDPLPLRGITSSRAESSRR